MFPEETCLCRTNLLFLTLPCGDLGLVKFHRLSISAIVFFFYNSHRAFCFCSLSLPWLFSGLDKSVCSFSNRVIFLHFSTEVVKGNVDLIPKAVKIWVERYDYSPGLATAELLSMLFEVVKLFLKYFPL